MRSSDWSSDVCSSDLSKGLEYPHVFLAEVEEGLLPHMGRDEDDADPAAAAEALAQRIQEERRLMYVGITRARRSLHLSWCKKRRRREAKRSEGKEWVSTGSTRWTPTH